jgi:hypothetical protein
VQLTRHTKTEHHDGLAREDVDLPLRMEARRENLDHRRDPRFDRTGQSERVAWRDRHILRKPAVPIAADEHAVAAEMCLPDAAMKAVPAIQLRIDNDAVAAAQLAGPGIDHFARHLVAHDPRVFHRNGTVEDLVIRAADPTVRHADEQLARFRPRARHIVANQLARRRQQHRFHRCARTSGLTGLRGDRPLSTATTSCAAFICSSMSDSSE